MTISRFEERVCFFLLLMSYFYFGGVWNKRNWQWNWKKKKKKKKGWVCFNSRQLQLGEETLFAAGSLVKDPARLSGNCILHLFSFTFLPLAAKEGCETHVDFQTPCVYEGKKKKASLNTLFFRFLYSFLHAFFLKSRSCDIVK